MRLVEFRGYQKGKVTFMADKIVAFMPNPQESDKTSIFVVSSGSENDEFIVGNTYEQVRTIMMCVEELSKNRN